MSSSATLSVSVLSPNISSSTTTTITTTAQKQPSSPLKSILKTTQKSHTSNYQTMDNASEDIIIDSSTPRRSAISSKSQNIHTFSSSNPNSSGKQTTPSVTFNNNVQKYSTMGSPSKFSFKSSPSSAPPNITSSISMPLAVNDENRGIFSQGIQTTQPPMPYFSFELLFLLMLSASCTLLLYLTLRPILGLVWTISALGAVLYYFFDGVVKDKLASMGYGTNPIVQSETQLDTQLTRHHSLHHSTTPTGYPNINSRDGNIHGFSKNDVHQRTGTHMRGPNQAQSQHGIYQDFNKGLHQKQLHNKYNTLPDMQKYQQQQHSYQHQHQHQHQQYAQQSQTHNQAQVQHHKYDHKYRPNVQTPSNRHRHPQYPQHPQNPQHSMQSMHHQHHQHHQNSLQNATPQSQSTKRQTSHNQ